MSDGGVWFLSIRRCWQGGSEPSLADVLGLTQRSLLEAQIKVYGIQSLFMFFTDLPNQGHPVRGK